MNFALIQGPWPLLVVAIINSVFIALFIFLVGWTPQRVDRWLQLSSYRRAMTALGLVVAAAGAFSVRLLDVTNVKRGIFEPFDFAFVACLALILGTPIATQMLTLKYTDKRDEENRDLRTQLASANAAEQKARRDEFFHLLVSKSFLKAINLKKNAVYSALQGPNRRIDPPGHLEPAALLGRYRKATDPRRQVKVLLDVVFEIFRALLDEVDNRARLRVAHFKIERGQLKPKYCWNGLSHNCLKSPIRKGRKNRFRLSDDEIQLAVKAAARTGEIIVVDDAGSFDKDPEKPFNFSQDGQEKWIKSLIAIPIGEPNENGLYEHILCIDTDKLAFFNDSQRQQLELVQNHLEQRLLCELGMEAMLFPQEQNDGRSK